MRENPRATVRQLAHKIRDAGQVAHKIGDAGQGSRFAFFLGAGASQQSGIITASEMIHVFKDRIVAECCPEDLNTDAKTEDWLRTQDWYKGKGSEYSKLFEKFEPKEIGRQRYIESIIEGKTPSFGYVVLANLIASKYIYTIITTNFDDLIYSACTSYTPIRPIVYAYGVLASEMRITAPRPKILKLHGDYLYSSLKNTGRELMAQDQNMARQVSQVLGEYGLVVVGYGGGDESVMNVLSQISERNDLYWCVHRGTEPNDAVKTLLTEKGGFLIEIDGFDEMMNEIRDIVGFNVGVMMDSLQVRQNDMIEKLKSMPFKYWGNILREVVAALKAQSQPQQDQIRKTETLDYVVRAYEVQSKGNHKEAEALYRKAIELDPNDALTHNNLGWSLRQDPTRYAEAESEFRKAIELNPYEPNAHENLNGLYYEQGKYDSAIATLRRAMEFLPDVYSRHNSLGYTYLLKGDLAEAEAEFVKAISMMPQAYTPILNLGLLRALQGKADQAHAFWGKGFALCQGNTIFDKLNRALYTLALGRKDQGIAAMQKVLHEDKPNAEDLRGFLDDAKVLEKSPNPPPGIKETLVLLQTAMTPKER